MPSVLIVDDLTSIHEMLEAVIQPIGFTSAFATDGTKAIERYKAERFDLVLVDVMMKPMDGLTLLKELKRLDPKAVVIIMTAYANTSNALEALKLGAFDFLQKPFKVDELISALKRGIEFKQLGAARAKKAAAHHASAASASAAESITATEQLDTFIQGESKKIKKLLPQIKKLVASKTPVLITGEPGTGKKAIAEMIHSQGAAPDSPFVRFDCTLVEEDEIRAGLIGPQGQGGAWIDQAKGGMLLLEHVQAMPMEIQKELVSVLRNTGNSFRLICSSTEDLEKMIDGGAFNEELFYRIAALPLVLPPLRERSEDIPELVKKFAGSAHNPRFDVHQTEFTDDAIDVLTAYRWPGNISELHQVIVKIVSEADSKVITGKQLPMRLHDLKDYPSLSAYLEGQEKQYLERVLHACRGDKAKAAKVLGVEAKKFS